MVDRTIPEDIPPFDPYNPGDLIHGDVRASLDTNTDAFDRVYTVDGARNVLDFASQYSLSSERLRLFRNGSRAFPQYNSISQFSDNADHWLLSPDAGDTMHIESAESNVYVVNFTIQSSWAFQLNQSLSSGDVFRFGPYNGTDGWVLEQRGADHTDTQADIIESVNGSETTLKSNVDLPKPFTDWYRWECLFGWYAVLNQVWTLTYPNGNDVIVNDIFARSSNAGNRGPQTGNLNLWVEIEADSSTSDLQLEVGSMGSVTIGDPTSIQRNKPQYESITLSGTADTWEPLLAVRIDPNNGDVNAQLTAINILDYGANADVEMIVSSFDASKTDASGFSAPEYQNNFNSALQSTESITQVPNTNGTQKDLTSSDSPGGHTLATAVDIDAGPSSGETSTSNQSRQEKRSILRSDHVVFLARSGTMDSDLKFVWAADQNW